MLKASLAIALVLSAASLAQAADGTFDFHSGFWVNLHHFLVEQASSSSPVPSDSPVWLAAVGYYKREVIKQDRLSDRAAAVNNRLSELENASTLNDSGLPAELITVLDNAAAAYRTRWWPEHDRANRAWIAALSPLISKYGGALKKDLAAAYGVDWPAAPIRADVAAADLGGGYTTVDPAHITISSLNRGNQGDVALEVIFHEASHVMVFRVRNALDAGLRSQNRLFRYRNFWHAVLFYTIGDIMQRHVDGYVPYALKNGIYERGWPGAPEVLDGDWKPYLDGKIDLATAVQRLVADYGVSR